MSSSLVWLHLHWIFVGLSLFGFTLAVIWAIKFAPEKKIFQWMIWTLVIGLLGMLLTVPFGMPGWSYIMGQHGYYGDRSEVFQEMKDEMEELWGDDELWDEDEEDRFEEMEERMDEMMDFDEEEETQ